MLKCMHFNPNCFSLSTAGKGDNRIISICLFSCQNCSKNRKKLQNILEGGKMATRVADPDPERIRNSLSCRTRILIQNTDPEV